jgi:hypothetical protein
VVDRRHGFREKAGVAKGDAEDKATNANARRIRRGRAQRYDGLEAVAPAALIRRLLKVIGDREPVEATLVCEAPQPSQLVERPAEVTDMDAELDGARLILLAS